MGDKITCPDDCKAQPVAVLENRADTCDKEIEELKKENKDRMWPAIANRPKTRTLLVLLGIALTIILSSTAIPNYINADKIEEEKKERIKYEQKNDREHENLEAKFDAVKDRMNDMEKSLIREIQKIKK